MRRCRRAFRRRLLAWFRRHGRDLPWRRTRDPYRILVSEVMLQQTQVARVTELLAALPGAFPDPAPPRRCSRATGCAKRGTASAITGVRQTSTGWRRTSWPDTMANCRATQRCLRSLPGVGRYTAGAVASFAWELAEPAVDTNVARVLRRVFHPRAAGGARGERLLDATARALLPRPGKTAWGTNQALMELGALVCTARVMHCESCPVRSLCRTGTSDPPGPVPGAGASRRGRCGAGRRSGRRRSRARRCGC